MLLFFDSLGLSLLLLSQLHLHFSFSFLDFLEFSLLVFALPLLAFDEFLCTLGLGTVWVKVVLVDNLMSSPVHQVHILPQLDVQLSYLLVQLTFPKSNQFQCFHLFVVFLLFLNWDPCTFLLMELLI